MTTVIRNQIQLVQSPWKAPAQKWQSRKILVLRAFAMVCKIYMLSTINITRIIQLPIIGKFMCLELYRRIILHPLRAQKIRQYSFFTT